MHYSNPEELIHDLNESGPGCESFVKIAANRPLVIYGHGQGYNTFTIFVLRKLGLKPALILDRKFSQGIEIDGCPAISPVNFMPDKVLLRHALLIVTVGKRQYHDEIIIHIKSLGFKDFLFATDIYEYHLAYSSQDDVAYDFNYFWRNFEAISHAFQTLSDEKSKVVFLELLYTYAFKKIIQVTHEHYEDQYFPSDLTLNAGYSRLINCGSFDGDTVRTLIKKEGKISALACFEPDETNFSRLSAYLRSEKHEIADLIVAFPCGLWSNSCVLSFDDNKGTNCNVSEVGDRKLQCVSIDEVLIGFEPTFINMDIEGSEPQALEGARNTISTYQPDLAISVYHRPNHLWEIIEQVSKLSSAYKFYLRNYSGYPAETVLYATS